MTSNPPDDQAAQDEEDVTIMDGTSDEEETMDIDKTMAGVGLQNDDNGPEELDSEDILNQADKDQD
jgi:hypothetical protein